MSTAALAPGLGRKVKKVLEVKTEAPGLVEALTTLSLLYHENTPHNRRALKSAVEQRGLEISETFLTAAETVIESLNEVSANLDGLSDSCARIFKVLSETKSSTNQLAADTERLQQAMEAVDVKVATVGQFLSQYQVSEDEVRALQSEEATDEFFAALAHVRRIHDNCRALLRTHHQRAGLELMDSMSMYQEMAYERLCRWIQRECRNMGDMDAPDVSSTLQTAIQALRDRPVLFKYCLEEVATARHNALFQRFIAALTRGGPGGMPRPIEIHAHDPKRYVNDMLAWVHQALADEREFVLALFGSSEGGAAPEVDSGFGRAGDASANGGDSGFSAAALLDRIFDSICRPLRVRIEQVLMTQLQPLLCFELAQLHSFYLQLVLRVLGPSAQLVVALRACRDVANRTFMEQMRARADKLLRNPPAPPKDLSAPQQVMDSVHTMLELVDAHELALQTTAPLAHSPDQPDDLQPVMGLLVSALIDACQRSAEGVKAAAQARADAAARPGAPAAAAAGAGGSPASASTMYVINCLAAGSNALGQRRSAARWAEQLSRATDEQITQLVQGEVQTVLTTVGCADLLDRLKLYRQDATGGEQTEALSGQPASDPSLSHTRIVEGLKAFFTLLSSPDALPEFNQIQVPRVRAAALGQFTQELSAAYEELYTALDNPEYGYVEQGGAASVRNTPQQVRTILGIA